MSLSVPSVVVYAYNDLNIQVMDIMQVSANVDIDSMSWASYKEDDKDNTDKVEKLVSLDAGFFGTFVAICSKKVCFLENLQIKHKCYEKRDGDESTMVVHKVPHKVLFENFEEGSEFVSFITGCHLKGKLVVVLFLRKVEGVDKDKCFIGILNFRTRKMERILPTDVNGSSVKKMELLSCSSSKVVVLNESALQVLDVRTGRILTEISAYVEQPSRNYFNSYKKEVVIHDFTPFGSNRLFAGSYGVIRFYPKNRGSEYVLEKELSLKDETWIGTSVSIVSETPLSISFISFLEFKGAPCVNIGKLSWKVEKEKQLEYKVEKIRTIDIGYSQETSPRYGSRSRVSNPHFFEVFPGCSLMMLSCEEKSKIHFLNTKRGEVFSFPVSENKRPELRSVIPFKEQRYVDEGESRFKSVIEYIDKCKSEKSTSSTEFWPRDLDVLFCKYEYTNKTLYLPRFLFYGGSCGNDDVVEGADCTFGHPSSLHEGMVIRCFIFGPERLSRYYSVTAEMWFDLALLLNYMGYRHFEELVWKELGDAKLLNLLTLFEKITRQENEEEEEEGEEDIVMELLLNDRSEVQMSEYVREFKSIHTLFIFRLLVSRKAEIKENYNYCKFLEKMGYFVDLDLSDRQLRVKGGEFLSEMRNNYFSHEDGNNNNNHLASACTSQWMKNVYQNYQNLDPNEEHVLLLRTGQKEDGDVIKMSKLLLCLTSNFFQKIFRLADDTENNNIFEENTKKEVMIQCLPTTKSLRYLLNLHLRFDNNSSTEEEQSNEEEDNINNIDLSSKIQVLRHCHMYREDLPFFEVYMATLSEMRKLGETPDSIMELVLKMGHEFLSLPSEIYLRMIEYSWGSKVDKMVISKVLSYSSKMKKELEEKVEQSEKEKDRIRMLEEKNRELEQRILDLTQEEEEQLDGKEEEEVMDDGDAKESKNEPLLVKKEKEILNGLKEK